MSFQHGVLGAVEMITRNTFFEQYRSIITLGLPILLGQMAQMSMAFVDTVVAGRAGAVEMAGVAVGGAFWGPFILLGQGILNAIAPLVAQGVGSGKDKSLRHFWRQGFWLAVFIAFFLLIIFVLLSMAMLNYKSIEPELAKVSSEYLAYIKWGIPPFLVFFVCRTYLEGRGYTRPAMIAGFIGLFFNIPLNYIFVFGYFGMPRLGGAGCALATAIVCWIMLFVLLYYMKKYAPLTVGIVKPQFKFIKRVFKIGLPNGLALLLEVSSFAFIAILIAPLGSVTVAGHQVAMNLSALVFMIPLSLGIACSIRIGTYLGAKDYASAISARQAGIFMAWVTGISLFLLLIIFRGPIAHLYSIDPEVISLASYIMLFAALYQIPDNLQIVYMGGLRAYNDTKSIFLICIISYWVVSLPLGYILCFTDFIVPQLGVQGFWIGLIAGLCVACVLLLFRLCQMERLPADKIAKQLAE